MTQAPPTNMQILPNPIETKRELWKMDGTPCLYLCVLGYRFPCVCGPQADAWCPAPSPYLLRQSFRKLAFTNWLNRLVNAPMDLGTSGTHSHTWLLTWTLELWTQPTSAQHLPSPETWMRTQMWLASQNWEISVYTMQLLAEIKFLKAQQFKIKQKCSL